MKTVIEMAREAGIISGFDTVHPSIELFAELVRAEALAEQPAQRTWVGLTYKEVQEIHDTYHKRMGPQEFSKAIEAKFKEKNT